VLPEKEYRNVAQFNLQSIAFPVLDDARIALAGQCTALTPRRCRNGETLIAVGDRVFKFFIVKSGEIEIVDYSGDEPQTILTHSKGNFTGDISHLTGTPAMFSSKALV
jgi:thioredoxin reductase (NADPH)